AQGGAPRGTTYRPNWRFQAHVATNQPGVVPPAHSLSLVRVSGGLGSLVFRLYGSAAVYAGARRCGDIAYDRGGGQGEWRTAGGTRGHRAQESHSGRGYERKRRVPGGMGSRWIDSRRVGRPLRSRANPPDYRAHLLVLYEFQL